MVKMLFPSFIYYAPVKSKKINIKEVIRECYAIMEMDEAGQKWSKKNYLNGYTSYSSVDRLYEVSTTFDDIRKAIDAHVKKYIEHLEMDIHHKDLQMTTFWINIMPPTVVHTNHIHPLSVISGTFYLQIPKNGSGIKFEDPRLECFMASPPRKENARLDNQRHFTLNPQPGHVALFESWMRHEIPPNPGTTDRISISFNYDWVKK